MNVASRLLWPQELPNLNCHFRAASNFLSAKTWAGCGKLFSKCSYPDIKWERCHADPWSSDVLATEATGEGPGERLRVCDGEDLPPALRLSCSPYPSPAPRGLSWVLTTHAVHRPGPGSKTASSRVNTEDGVEEDGMDPGEGPVSLCMDEMGCSGRVLADLAGGRLMQMPKQPSVW